MMLLSQCNLCRYTTALLLLFACFALQSRTATRIHGSVLDAATGAPLNGANITLENQAAGASTDASGRFELVNLFPGDYILNISYIGYQPREQRVQVTGDQPVVLNIRLQPAVVQLRDVVVEADSPGERGRTTVINDQTLRRTGAEDLGQALQSVGGLAVTSSGGNGASAGLSIRGSETNQVLVLLDGRRLNDPVSGEVDLAQIPVQSVKRVEITKGAASARYGSGALGGVVNIVTGGEHSNQIRLRTRLGSYGFFTTEPSVSLQTQHINATLSYQRQSADNAYPYAFQTADDEHSSRQRVNADMSRNNLFAGADARYGDHSIGVKAQLYDTRRGLPGSIYSLTPWAESRIQRHTLTLNYRFQRNTLELTGSLAYADHQTTDKNLWPDNAALKYRSTPRYRFSSRTVSPRTKWMLNYKANGWWRIRCGMEARVLEFENRDELRSASVTLAETTEHSYGVFMDQQLTARSRFVKLSLHSMLRFDRTVLDHTSGDRVIDQWSPAVNAYLSPAGYENLSLRASWSRGFRLPTYADLFYRDFRVQGQADLLPETSLNREFGVTWTLQTPWQPSIDASRFHYSINNMIVWRMGNFQVFSPDNTDARVHGEEISVQTEIPASRVQLHGHYMHIRSINKNKNITLFNNHLPYRPRHTVKAGISMQVPDWHARLNARVVGERFLNQANTKHLPGYTVVDFTTSYTLHIRHADLTLQLQINNLLDERYQIIRDMPMPPREWRLGLEYSLNRNFF
ncbi:MAG: TonB-dependent receptor [candidate division KSB1 bacterium]|nr:TonB-dependent receptor [candidate division KSB1 bacterium]